MPLSTAQRLAALSVPMPLAIEFGRQIDAGSYNARRLTELGMVQDLAKYVATSLTAGTFSVEVATELGMVSAVAALTQSTGGGGSSGIVPVPALFDGYTGYPVQITRFGTGTGSTFTTNFNFNATKPVPGGTIFVGPDGNNANDGLTYANRVRSLGTAITKANALGVSVARIRAKPGHYWRYNGSLLSDHFAGVLPTCDLLIEADTENGGPGDAYSWGNHGAAVVWVQQGVTPVYKSTSFGTSGTNINIVDRANLDGNGDPISLFRVHTVANPADPSAELAAAVAAYGRGAVYFNTTPSPDEMWVQLFNGRTPDANVVCLSAATGSDQLKITNVAKRRIWLDGIQIIGGAGCLEVTASASARHEIYARNCVFNAAAGPANVGLSSERTTAVFENCRASDAYGDGFNYHGDTVSSSDPEKSPAVLEIGLGGQRNGLSGSGTNNTSTSHEAVRVISVECNFGSSADRPVHDVGNTRRWMTGGSVAAPIETSSDDGLVRAGGGGGDTSVVLLDAVDLAPPLGSQFQISALVVGTKCLTRNMDRTGLVTNGNGDTGTY